MYQQILKLLKTFLSAKFAHRANKKKCIKIIFLLKCYNAIFYFYSAKFAFFFLES